MAKSTNTTRSRKSRDWKKPYTDFPLSYHPPSGRLYKKIRGHRYYFGYVDDWQAAINLYKEQCEDLYAGRTPKPKQEGAYRLCDLLNGFKAEKDLRLSMGRLAKRTWYEYIQTGERLKKFFGRERAVADLGEDDFRSFATELAKTRGLVSLANEIVRVRTIFRWGVKNGKITQPLYGTGFEKPKQTEIDKDRLQKKQSNGKKMFGPADLRKIIDAAPQPLKTMILLGVNCGFGAADCGRLYRKAVDLDKGWIEFPRVKTAIERRCWLWPSTVEALKDALAIRPDPKDPDDADLIFITKYGHQWVRLNAKGTPDDAIGKEFAKLLNRLDLKRTGVSFYALRHTLQTIGGEAKDPDALRHIMGHKDTSMARYYREDISDDRLRAVAETVRNWLFSKSEK